MQNLFFHTYRTNLSFPLPSLSYRYFSLLFFSFTRSVFLFSTQLFSSLLLTDWMNIIIDNTIKICCYFIRNFINLSSMRDYIRIWRFLSVQRYRANEFRSRSSFRSLPLPTFHISKNETLGRQWPAFFLSPYFSVESVVRLSS